MFHDGVEILGRNSAVVLTSQATDALLGRHIQALVRPRILVGHQLSRRLRLTDQTRVPQLAVEDARRDHRGRKNLERTMSEPAPETVLLVLTKQALVDLVQQEHFHVLRAIRALLLRTEEDRDLFKDELIDRRQHRTAHERRGRIAINRTDRLGALLSGSIGAVLL